MQNNINSTIFTKLKNVYKNKIIVVQSVMIVILIIYVVNLRIQNNELSDDVDYANSQTSQLAQEVDEVNSNFDYQDWSEARESLSSLASDTQYQ